MNAEAHGTDEERAGVYTEPRRSGAWAAARSGAPALEPAREATLSRASCAEKHTIAYRCGDPFPGSNPVPLRNLRGSSTYRDTSGL